MVLFSFYIAYIEWPTTPSGLLIFSKFNLQMFYVTLNLKTQKFTEKSFFKILTFIEHGMV